jgi:hypothetical protein
VFAVVLNSAFSLVRESAELLPTPGFDWDVIAIAIGIRLRFDCDSIAIWLQCGCDSTAIAI